MWVGVKNTKLEATAFPPPNTISYLYTLNTMHDRYVSWTLKDANFARYFNYHRLKPLFATNPAADCCDVHLVLLAELGCKITFLWLYENVMAGNKGRYEKNQKPGKIER
jgi:hypothetical protein